MLVNVCPSALCVDGTPEIPALIASFVVPAMERGARTDVRAGVRQQATDGTANIISGRKERQIAERRSDFGLT